MIAQNSALQYGHFDCLTKRKRRCFVESARFDVYVHLLMALYFLLSWNHLYTVICRSFWLAEILFDLVAWVAGWLLQKLWKAIFTHWMSCFCTTFGSFHQRVVRVQGLLLLLFFFLLSLSHPTPPFFFFFFKVLLDTGSNCVYSCFMHGQDYG